MKYVVERGTSQWWEFFIPFTYPRPKGQWTKDFRDAMKDDDLSNVTGLIEQGLIPWDENCRIVEVEE